jgi:hypothetical protein
MPGEDGLKKFPTESYLIQMVLMDGLFCFLPFHQSYVDAVNVRHAF